MLLKDNIRKISRKIILDILGLFSTPKKGIHILNGHRISLDNVDSCVFRSQLELLSKKVTFVRFEYAVNLIIKNVKVDKSLVAFSFDDGFDECYTKIAPILEEFGVNAAFFINPNFVDGDQVYIENFTKNIVRTPNKKPMTWDEIIDLHKRGFIIGSHTLDHYNINDDNIIELERQIGGCKKYIEDKLNISCDYFAFPFGRLEHANRKSIDIGLKYYKYVFSQSNYKNYFSFNGKVINRRHFEPDWPIRHVYYFLSCKKKWNK